MHILSLSRCVPTTCAREGALCGTVPDGCGVDMDCGRCNRGMACTAHQCTGCDGVANSGLLFDACGICGGQTLECMWKPRCG